jgi:hypothetical protein
MLEWLRAEYPDALPRVRALLDESRPQAKHGRALEDALAS